MLLVVLTTVCSGLLFDTLLPMLQVLAAERSELLAARSAGAYTSRTLTRAQRALDLTEATLQQIPDLT